MSRRARRLQWSSAFLTVVWLALCWLYIASEVGWPVLIQLLPHEIGLVVTGVLAPLALLWAMTLAETRTDQMATELQRQVSVLLAAPAAALTGAESAADTLLGRARGLADAATEATRQLEGAAARLQDALEQAATLSLELERARLQLAHQTEETRRMQELARHPQPGRSPEPAEGRLSGLAAWDRRTSDRLRALAARVWPKEKGSAF